MLSQGIDADCLDRTMNTAGTIIVVLLVLLVVGGIGWVLFARWRAQRLGVRTYFQVLVHPPVRNWLTRPATSAFVVLLHPLPQVVAVVRRAAGARRHLGLG